MKKLLTYFSLFAVIFIAGCTQNNGIIGDWFGTWRMVSVTIDGEDDATYQGNVLWKFQSDIIQMVTTDDENHSWTTHNGTWTQVDDTLIVKFDYKSDAYPNGGGAYAPAPATHIPVGVSDLQIIKLAAREIILSYTADDGKVYVYTLEKWG